MVGGGNLIPLRFRDPATARPSPHRNAWRGGGMNRSQRRSHAKQQAELGVGEVFVGTVTGVATATNVQRPAGELDEEGMDENGEWWEEETSFRCDFEIQPLPAPAPTATPGEGEA